MVLIRMIDFIFSILPNIFFLILVFLALTFCFRIIRFIYNFLRYLRLTAKYSRRRPKVNYKTYQPKPTNKTDYRRKDKKQEIIEYNKKVNIAQTQTNEYEIVGIAEPIGKWTKFVTQQKMGWLKAMVGSKVDSDQFWQNMVKAQQQASSKHKGRGGHGI